MCAQHPTNCGVCVEPGTQFKLRVSTVEVTNTQRIAVTQPTNENGIKKKGRPKKTEAVYEDRTVVVLEPTVKVLLWRHGVESCCVGYVSRCFQNVYVNQLDGRVIGIKELYSESTSESVRQRSLENNGMALAVILS